VRSRPIATWVEVVLVTFIGAIVLGVFVGLTGRIREAAERAKCENNLRQLGLAIHNYLDQTLRLPPLADEGDGAPTGWGLPSIFANLMVYMEQTNLVFRPERPPDYYHGHSSVVFTYPHKGDPIRQVGGMANHVIPVFLDPADATADRLNDIPMTLPDGSTGYYATGSYAANGLIPWGVRVPPERWAAMRNVILFGERVQVCRTASGDDVYNLWGLGIYSPHMPAFVTLTPADPPGLMATGQIAPDKPLADKGAAEHNGSFRVRIGRQEARPEPLGVRSPVQIVRRGRPCDPRLPASPHAAGMQVVMGDASVRLLGPDTSPSVLWAVCIPDGPED
jgi:hypothetical protein